MSAVRKLKTVDKTYEMIEAYREIKQRIAALEEEAKLIYTNLTDGYFKDHDTFEYNGRLVATYLTSIRQTFNKKEFEKAHPKLLKEYTVEQEYKTLRLK